MNKQERDYAAKRVENIHAKKVAALGLRPNSMPMTKEEATAYVMSKKAVIKELHVSYNYGRDPYISVSYALPEPTKTDSDKLIKAQAVYDDKLTALKIAATEVTDEIMLGDSQRALDLLKSFENSK